MKQLYLVLVLTLLTFFHTIVAIAYEQQTLSTVDPVYCSPSEVLSYSPGKDLSGNELPANRKLTNLALDVDGDVGDDYVSLGFNGSITLKYNFPIRNLPGKDLIVTETSPEGKNCNVHKPSVAVYASQDNLSWILVADGCQDLEVDLGGLAWAQYFKIIDISNPNDFIDPLFDGYHLDGIKALQCPNYPELTNAIVPFVKCVKDNGNGTFTATFGYENLNLHFTAILNGTNNNVVFDDVNATHSVIPTIFEAGSTLKSGNFHSAFEATFSSGSVTWSLLGPDNVLRTAVASASPTKCISAVLRGGDDICSGEITSIFVDLEGVAPWEITYTSTSGQSRTVVASSSPFEIKISFPATYSLEKVVDGEGHTANIFGIARVLNKPTPTAILTGDGKTCENEILLKVEINCNCIPFYLTYSDGIKDTTVITSKTEYYIVGKVGRTYTLKSISNMFCNGVASGSVTVTKVLPTAELVKPSETCVSENSFTSIGVNLTGTSPWTVRYTKGGIQKDTTVSADHLTIKGYPGFTYVLISVTDAKCTAPATGSVAIYAKPSALISGSNVICNANEASDLTITFSGIAPFTYVYSNGTSQIEAVSQQSSVSFSVTGPGSYHLVSVVDAHCDGTVSGNVEITIMSVSATFEVNPAYCHGEYISLSPIFNGSPVETFEFTTSGKGVISNTQSGILYFPASDETGEILFTLTGSSKCGIPFSPTTKKTLLLEKVKSEITYTPTEVYVDEPVQFSTVNQNSEKQYWLIEKNNVSNDKFFEFIFSEPGVKQVILSVEENGCYGFDTVLVNVKFKNPLIYVPNIFSISSQNLENKVVKVYGQGVANDGFKFKIFNKWGNLLFEVNDFTLANTNGWNGKINGSGELQPIGVYTYLLEGKFVTGEKFKKTGTVTLVK